MSFRPTAPCDCVSRFGDYLALPFPISFTNVDGQHSEVETPHSVQAPSPAFYGAGGDEAAGPHCEHGSSSRSGSSLGEGSGLYCYPPRLTPRVLLPLRGDET